MGDLTMPVRRFWMDRTQPQGAYQTAPAPPRSGYITVGEINPAFKASDLLMTDVVSFDVRVLLAGDSDFRDLYDPIVQQFAPPNAANSPGFSFQGNGPRVFDTWSSKTDSITGVNYSNWNGPWQTPALPATATTIPLYQESGRSVRSALRRSR